MMNNIIDSFRNIYTELNAKNIESVNSIYDEDIIFIDPFHEIRGLEALRNYFNGLYKNVISCEFSFGEIYAKNNSAMILWTMALKHRSLSGKNPIYVSGNTHIRFNEKIYLHRDYFDAGQMLYENLPLVGSVIKFIKQKV